MKLKFLPAFFCIIFLPVFAVAQNTLQFRRAEACLSRNKKTVTKFSVPQNQPGQNVLVLETPFAKADFINAALAATAKGKVIVKVQLVYTTFAVSPSFDQQGLNQRRLKNLYAVLPDAFKNAWTEWELVGQTGATSPEDGRKYFHGFVITFRPDASAATSHNEISALDSLFALLKNSGGKISSSGSIKIDSASGGTTTPVKMKELKLPDGTVITLRKDFPEDSLIYVLKPDPGQSIRDARYGDTAHSTVVVTEYHEGHKMKRVWKLDDHLGTVTPDNGFDKKYLYNPDSIITVTMKRNDWKNAVVVCDVTSSMEPYTAQVFTWIYSAAASGKYSGFVFFNDGDNKKDNSKQVGKTGGIYSTHAQSPDSVLLLARKAMQNGCGGDQPENDVEALIYAITKMNPTGDIVLIADNYATPRDMELISKINRPVHFVLCGARVAVNPDYLYLAYVTGGSIHTLTQDITNLSSLKDGDTITINNQHFLLHDGHFVCTDTFDDIKF